MLLTKFKQNILIILKEYFILNALIIYCWSNDDINITINHIITLAIQLELIHNKHVKSCHNVFHL